MKHEELYDKAKEAIEAVFNDDVSAETRRASLEELSVDIDDFLNAIEADLANKENE